MVCTFIYIYFLHLFRAFHVVRPRPLLLCNSLLLSRSGAASGPGGGHPAGQGERPRALPTEGLAPARGGGRGHFWAVCEIRILLQL